MLDGGFVPPCKKDSWQTQPALGRGSVELEASCVTDEAEAIGNRPELARSYP
jgi:hypothetical protein